MREVICLSINCALMSIVDVLDATTLPSLIISESREYTTAFVDGLGAETPKDMLSPIPGRTPSKVNVGVISPVPDKYFGVNLYVVPVKDAFDVAVIVTNAVWAVTPVELITNAGVAITWKAVLTALTVNKIFLVHVLIV